MPQTSEENLEQYIESSFDWKSDTLSSGNIIEEEAEIVSGLYYILRNEINRQQKLLWNDIGRQPAVDWFESLADHQKWFGIELDTLELLVPHQEELKRSIELFDESLNYPESCWKSILIKLQDVKRPVTFL